MDGVRRWRKDVAPSGHTYYYLADGSDSQWDRPGDYVSEDESDNVIAQREQHNTGTAKEANAGQREAEISKQNPLYTAAHTAQEDYGTKAAVTPSTESRGKQQQSRGIHVKPLMTETIAGQMLAPALGSPLPTSARPKEPSGSGTGKRLSVSALAGFKTLAQRWKARAGVDQHHRLEFSSRGVMGIPVRDLLQALYKAKRDKTLKEGLIFVMWAICFFLVVYGTYDIQLTHETNKALEERFVTQDFPGETWHKSFLDVSDPGEFQDWMSGPLLAGLYPQETYSGFPMPSNRYGNVNEFLRIVGAVSLRQVRVRNDSCAQMRLLSQCDVAANNTACPGRFDTTDGTCFGSYSKENEEKRPFGPSDEPDRYKWSAGHSKLAGLYGWGPEYGDGGFVVFLPSNNVSAAEDIIAEITSDGYFDRSTRAVSVDFNVYNTATGMVSVTRLLFEYFPTSYAQVSYYFYTFYLDVVPTTAGRIIVSLQYVYMAFVLYWTQKVVKGFYWAKPWYTFIFSFYNVCDIALVAMNMYLAVQWTTFYLGSIFHSFSVNGTQYSDLHDLGLSYLNMVSVIGFVGVVGALKFFKYIALQKRMSIIWLTLGKAAPELAAFTVALFIVVAGYAFTAHMLFGAYLAEYHSFEACTSSLLRMAVGDFDYDTLSNARPAIVSVFFGSYITLVYLISLNIVIAIISKFYDLVHQELRSAEKWKLSVVTVDSYILQRLVLFFRLRCGRVKRAYSYGRAWCYRACTCQSLRNRRTPPLVHVTTRKRNRAHSTTAQSGNPMRHGRRGTAAKLATVFDMTEEEAFVQADREARRARRIQSDQRQLDVWKHESEFMHELGRLYHMGKRKKGFDLYMYLEKTTDDVGWDNCYISLHELCVLTNANPCEPGCHLACQARRTIDAYQKVKMVTMTGALTGAYRHVPADAWVNTHGYRQFELLKCNVAGKKQRRWLVVDVANARLVNIDESRRVRKKLPLVQLLQIEKFPDDACRLSLVFSSNGPHVASLGYSKDLHDLLETSYDLFFQHEDDRDDFVDEVLQAMDRLPAILSGQAVTGDEENRKSHDTRGEPLQPPRRASLTSKVLHSAKEEYMRRMNVVALSALPTLVSEQRRSMSRNGEFTRETSQLRLDATRTPKQRTKFSFSAAATANDDPMQDILAELRAQRQMLEELRRALPRP